MQGLDWKMLELNIFGYWPEFWYKNYVFYLVLKEFP